MPLTPVKMFRGTDIAIDGHDESKWLDCLINLDLTHVAQKTASVDFDAVTLSTGDGQPVFIRGTMDDLKPGGKPPTGDAAFGRGDVSEDDKADALKPSPAHVKDAANAARTVHGTRDEALTHPPKGGK